MKVEVLERETGVVVEGESRCSSSLLDAASRADNLPIRSARACLKYRNTEKTKLSVLRDPSLCVTHTHTHTSVSPLPSLSPPLLLLLLLLLSCPVPLTLRLGRLPCNLPSMHESAPPFLKRLPPRRRRRKRVCEIKYNGALRRNKLGKRRS